MTIAQNTPIRIGTSHATAEASKSLRQMDTIFGETWNDLLASRTVRLDSLEALFVGLSIMHPTNREHRDKGSGSFHKATNSFHAQAAVRYVDWVSPTWIGRVTAYADAVSRAIVAIHKTRIGDSERRNLLSLVSDAREMTAERAPETLASIRPIYLLFDGRQPIPIQTSYTGRPICPTSAHYVVEVVPGEAHLHCAKPRAVQVEPTGYRLFRKIDGQLFYDEAWAHQDDLTRHLGQVGTQGSRSTVRVTGATAQQSVLNDWKAEAKVAGYKSIAESRLKPLLVYRLISNNDPLSDLQQRHALEEFLNRQLGWLGLGHCDGGSIGSGMMEAHCMVVDVALTHRCLSEVLAASPFHSFSIIDGRSALPAVKS